MAKRVAKSTLNATTLDILNVIRKNAGYQYQKRVPNMGGESVRKRFYAVFARIRFA